MATLESLLEVLTAVLSAQAAHDQLNEKFMLNGEEIFNDMDHHKVGYITSSAFARWVQTNCQFSLNESDLLVLQPVFDDGRQHRFTKEDFITAVSAPELQEDDIDAIPANQVDPEEAKPAAQTKKAEAKIVVSAPTVNATAK